MEANTLSSYTALALQVTCHAVNSARSSPEAIALIHQSITRLEQQIAASLAFIGSDCRLVVLPEYFLTGFPMEEPLGCLG